MNIKFLHRLSLSAVVLSFGALSMLQGCSETPEVKQPTKVIAMKTSAPSSLAQAPFPGKAKAGKEVNLSFRVSGQLMALPAEVGMQVTEGQELAKLDPKTYINAVGAAQGQLDRAIASSHRARADYERLQNVYEQDPGATSESALDLAEASYHSNVANSASLKSTLETAKDRLNYTTLKAPFDGTIVATYTENHQSVLVKQPVLRMLDSSTLEFVIYVPESGIKYVQYIESINVVFDAFPDHPISAKVKEVAREASHSTRTYPVTLEMRQPDDVEILPGMAGSAQVSARFPEGLNQHAIEIPATAVFSSDDSDQSYVWVVDPNTQTLEQRAVEILKLSRHGLKIRQGLEPGELIVIKGVHSVRANEQVRVEEVAKTGGVL